MHKGKEPLPPYVLFFDATLGFYRKQSYQRSPAFFTSDTWIFFLAAVSCVILNIIPRFFSGDLLSPVCYAASALLPSSKSLWKLKHFLSFMTSPDVPGWFQDLLSANISRPSLKPANLVAPVYSATVLWIIGLKAPTLVTLLCLRAERLWNRTFCRPPRRSLHLCFLHRDISSHL